MIYFDLSHPIENRMQVFPGEEPPTLLRDVLPEDAGYVTYRLETNMHTGTHMDAPLHICSGDRMMGSYDISLFAGRAMVLDVRGEHKVFMQPGWEEIFREYPVILFLTGHDTFWGKKEYYRNYPEFDNVIAEKMVAGGVRIAGFDSPSPDKHPYQFHKIYLKGQRFLVENLTGLDRVKAAENLEVMCFPLKIDAEASPVRAVACRRD